MPPRGQPPPEVPAQPERRRARRAGQPGPQRAVAEPRLQVDREAEQEPAVGDHEQRHRRQPGQQPRCAEHRHRQQRVAAARSNEPFDVEEDGHQREPAADAGERPRGPVLLVPQHQRQHHQAHRGHGHQQARAGRAAGSGPGASAGITRGSSKQDREPDRHVDQEDRPPRRPEQVGGHQHPADHLPGDEARGQHRGVGAQRPRPRGPAEPQLDHGHDLRHHRRRARALHEPGRDQHADVRREPAGKRGEREPADAEQEHPPPADQVAQPRPGDQQHRVADGVPGDDELQFRARRVQRPADRRHRHVDDRSRRASAMNWPHSSTTSITQRARSRAAADRDRVLGSSSHENSASRRPRPRPESPLVMVLPVTGSGTIPADSGGPRLGTRVVRARRRGY